MKNSLALGLIVMFSQLTVPTAQAQAVDPCLSPSSACTVEARQNAIDARLEKSSFLYTQLFAIEAALQKRGLPVKEVRGWRGGGFMDDFFQGIGALGQEAAAMTGYTPAVDGHFYLTVVISRPNRNSSVACDARVQFEEGSTRIHFMDLRYCRAIPAFNVRDKMYAGKLFGKTPDLTSNRDCTRLQPGTTEEGSNRENCMVTKIRAIEDGSEKSYEMVVQNTDVFKVEQ